MKVVSLFTGAGGLDLGLEAAGFTTSVAIEMNAPAVETLRFNRPWPVLCRDIHDVPSDEIMRVGGLREGDADLLCGGPPCQPFSKSGYWATGDTKRLDDPRASTIEAYLRVLRDLKPRSFLIENVSGLAYKQKDEGLSLIERTVDDINRETGTNYSLSYRVLNAADYGVPQERERVFIIGHREGRDFKFSPPTHYRPDALQMSFSAVEPHTTAWDAIGDLQDVAVTPDLRVTGKWAALLPSIPEGENYLHHTDRGNGLPLFGWRRRFWSFLLKLSKRRPSWTITAQPGSAIGPFHWSNRRLSSRELCRLQTFPDDFTVLGSRAQVQKQLGNAVPSALAEFLGREIRNQLLDQPTDEARKLVPPRRTPVPGPEPLAPVARKYLHLVGEHSAHPGTGQGNAAMLR